MKLPSNVRKPGFEDGRTMPLVWMNSLPTG
jgi:hypothetical protein